MIISQSIFDQVGEHYTMCIEMLASHDAFYRSRDQDVIGF